MDDLNSGRRTLVEALQAVGDEFPIEEHRAFIDATALNIEQGAPLMATLGDMSNSLQSEIENELLDRGLPGFKSPSEVFSNIRSGVFSGA